MKKTVLWILLVFLSLTVSTSVNVTASDKGLATLQVDNRPCTLYDIPLHEEKEDPSSASRPFNQILPFTSLTLGELGERIADLFKPSRWMSSRKRVLHLSDSNQSFTVFQADKQTYYILLDDTPQVSNHYHYEHYRAMDVSTGKHLVLRHIIGRSNSYEEMCYKVQNQLEHAPFREYPLFGDVWIPIKEIKGRSLKAELADPASPYARSTLYKKAKQQLENLHRHGYYHGSAFSHHFLVEQGTGRVYLINYRQCGFLYRPHVMSRRPMLPYQSLAKSDRNQLAKSMSVGSFLE